MKIKEIRRQILHILIGIFFLILIIYNLISPLELFILLIISGILSFASLRFKVPIVNFLLEKFERKNPDLPGKAFIMFLAGILITWKIFPLDIALASITILTFADPISHFIGENFGKTNSIINKKKNIEGHIAGFVISSLFAMFFVSPLIALAGAFIAMIFESLIIEIQKIQLDDDLIIPLVAGATMLLIKIFLII
jgi:dolichol kinase